jgi:hypothetical protein
MEGHHRRQHQRAPGRGRSPGDGGFSMIATVLALLIVALGAALLLGSTLHSGGNTSSGHAASPGVAFADRTQAQQSLTTGLSAAQTVATTAGGFSAVTPTELQAANPSITFVNGPSSAPTTVSVAVSASGGAGAGGGGDPSTGAGGIPNIPGVTSGGGVGSAGAGNGNGNGSDTSGITLADRSSDGVCWLIWKSTGSATWYGAQTGLTSCNAPQMSTTPTPGPVSASAIGWQQGSFPSP